MYSVHNATISDSAYLANVIVEAEKSNSGILSFCTLFNLSEAEAVQLIISMLEEEIEGCEFSLQSFLIVKFHETPVAAFGAWIEGVDTENASAFLKSNLIRFTFKQANLSFLQTKAEIIKDILIPRERNSLQLEYLFVDREHRGKGLTAMLIDGLIEKGLARYPSLKKVQVQVYGNNLNAIAAYKRSGFVVAQSFKSRNDQILNYLPSDEKYLMEKTLNTN